MKTLPPEGLSFKPLHKMLVGAVSSQMGKKREGKHALGSR